MHMNSMMILWYVFNEKNSNILYCFDGPIFKHQTQKPYYCFIINGVFFFHSKTISNDRHLMNKLEKKWLSLSNLSHLRLLIC